MKKKKPTDEEIVKDIERSTGMPSYWKKIVLDLIHRLQGKVAEYERKLANGDFVPVKELVDKGELVSIDWHKQIEEMSNDIKKIAADWTVSCEYSCNSCPYGSCRGKIATFLIEAGYRKIPEGAVVLTDKELNEELDTIKCAMIVHDDDGERYVSYDDYKEFTDRLGKIVRQRKVRIEQLEKLLDDKCDRCIERERKETAEKFSRLVEFHSVATRDENGQEMFSISALALKEILVEEFGFKYNEICKELIGDK